MPDGQRGLDLPGAFAGGGPQGVCQGLQEGGGARQAVAGAPAPPRSPVGCTGCAPGALEGFSYDVGNTAAI